MQPLKMGKNTGAGHTYCPTNTENVIALQNRVEFGRHIQDQLGPHAISGFSFHRPSPAATDTLHDPGVPLNFASLDPKIRYYGG
jgi:hypothetical protein